MLSTSQALKQLYGFCTVWLSSNQPWVALMLLKYQLIEPKIQIITYGDGYSNGNIVLEHSY